jgi:uncharacterized protein (DUF1810 family)
MPCLKCHSKVTESTKKKNIWFCKCGICNLCHHGGVYWNNDNYSVAHWYQRSRKVGELKPFLPGQAHGGRKLIPDIDHMHSFLRTDSPKNADIKVMDILKQKQQMYLPTAINELVQNGYKQSHWAWWAFPIDKPGGSEPKPKTYLTTHTALLYLNNPSSEWKELLNQIVTTITKYRRPIADIFPNIDHARIKTFITFFKKIITLQKKKSLWLSKILDKMETNFYTV